jgi:hypothetical protein
MKKHFYYLTLLLSILTTTFISAQTTTSFNNVDVKDILSVKINDALPDSAQKWNRGALFNTNFTNTTLSNWAAGGQNALTITTMANLFANYKNGDKQWSNSLELGYGITRLGKSNAPFRKGDDKMIFTSKYGRKIYKQINLSGLVDFRSQFDRGFKYEIDTATKGEKSTYISNFFAPAYVVASIGMEYKPNDKFYVLASPLTSKNTIVNDEALSDMGAFGVQKGGKIRSEFGAYLNSELKFAIMENVMYQSNANLFMNYSTPKLIDVFWDNLISLTVNKYITTTFSWVLVYDDDIKIKRDNGSVGPSLQAKTVLSVGINVKL